MLGNSCARLRQPVGHRLRRTICYDCDGAVFVRPVDASAEALKRFERLRRGVAEQIMPADRDYRVKRMYRTYEGRRRAVCGSVMPDLEHVRGARYKLFSDFVNL